MFALGLAAALTASALFNLGIALQALDARAQPKDQGLRLSLLARLARRRRWVIGFALGILGFPLEILAFADASFVVVQPALAAGLVLLLFLGARVLGERVSRAEVIGVVAIVAGVALLAWGAPNHTETHRPFGFVLGTVALLSILAFFPFAVRGRKLDTAMVAVLGSAVGFAAVNVATKLMSDDFNDDRFLAAGAWLVVVIVTGIAALVTEMTALQRREATLVVPVSFAVQTFLPILLEPAFLRERWASAELHGGVLAIGLVTMLAGTIVVSRARAVTELIGSPDEPPRGA